jgi:tetratricopeptide (TPR) repeat protein
MFASRIWNLPAADEYAAAVAWLDDATDGAPVNLETARHLADLGALLYAGGQEQRGQDCLERTLSVSEHITGGESTSAEACVYLGMLFLDRREYRWGQILLEQAHTLAQTALGPHHPATAFALMTASEGQRVCGQLVRARISCERAIARLDATLGPRHPAVARTLIQLATICTDLGERIVARQLANQALELCEAQLGDQPLTAQAHACLGRLAVAERDRQIACMHLDHALAIYRSLPHLQLPAARTVRVLRHALNFLPLALINITPRRR